MCNSHKVVEKLVVKAVLDNRLITDGDRVLVACSGGKDSTVLAMMLSNIRREIKKDYTVEAVHISTDFCSCCKKSELQRRLADWGVPFSDIFVPVIGRLKPGRKMNCYWCSTQRRTELLRFAMANRFNKIALGHHLDDIIETFFMNLCMKGKLETMPVELVYNKYPLRLIRPLAYVEERQIIDCAAEDGILQHACTCPYGAHSPRKDVRARLATFCAGNSAEKRRILQAVAPLPLSPPPLPG
jgi:tRNA 2-thiocytidine biosynthesis protein TtcA